MRFDKKILCVFTVALFTASFCAPIRAHIYGCRAFFADAPVSELMGSIERREAFYRAEKWVLAFAMKEDPAPDELAEVTRRIFNAPNKRDLVGALMELGTFRHEFRGFDQMRLTEMQADRLEDENIIPAEWRFPRANSVTGIIRRTPR